MFSLSSVSKSANYKPFEIKSGDGFMEIAGNLYGGGFIRSYRAFIFYGAFSGSAHLLKPGNYLISTGSSTPSILGAIKRGPILDKSIFIPEGATLKDIDALLSEAKIIIRGSLIKFPIKEIKSNYAFLKDAKSLEGFLFPDTYRFFLNSQPNDILEKFLDNFQKKAQPLLASNKLPITNYQLLITASLLEKEVPDYGDRRLVAGIIYKRLDLGMGLQIDATIVYAKCLETFITCDKPRILRSDLKLQSSYNTYLYRGLPPGPIGNPGLEAIRAALNPEKSDYLYYLSDPKTKKTIFSENFDEHNENRAAYLGY